MKGGKIRTFLMLTLFLASTSTLTFNVTLVRETGTTVHVDSEDNSQAKSLVTFNTSKEDDQRLSNQAITEIDAFTGHERTYGYWTPYIGLGWNQSADAYTMEELVTLYSWVVYNNNPMAARLVSFEVYSPVGLFLVKTNMTDENGVAFIKFRLPKACMDYEDYMGKWYCFQKVNLGDEHYNDTLWFHVNWIVEFQEVIPYGYQEGQWKSASDFTFGEHLGFLVKLKNIALIPHNVTIIIETYDDNNVSMSKTVVRVQVPEGQFDNPKVFQIFTLSLEIPREFYPGTGKVIVNVSTDLSTEGHSYCPPITAHFELYAQARWL